MIQINKSSDFKQAIPDNDKKGLVDILTVNQQGTIEDIKLDIDVEHPSVADLEVSLVAPSGKNITLHNRGDQNIKNLKKTYGTDTFKNVIGSTAKGKWKLQVKDFASKDTGALLAWSIDMRCSTKDHKTEIHIPDTDQKTLKSVQSCRLNGRITGMKVILDIEHPFISDLKVQLASPTGKTVVLHNRQGVNAANIKRTFEGEILQDFIGDQTKGDWTLLINDHAPKDKGILKHWKIAFRFTEVDDLKKVEGIGPKIESLLNADGIYSWKMLAASGVPRLRRILTDAGDRFKMHSPNTWPQQADLAAKGRWDELNVLQDNLKGGREN